MKLARCARAGRAARLALLFFVVALLAACHTEADEARRADVARVAHAVDVLRNAPNDAKPPLLRTLIRTPCKSADACRLQRVCLEGYRREQNALDGVRAVRHALGQDAGTTAAGRAGDLLELSKRELDHAHLLTRRCVDLESELSRRYKF